MGGTATRTGRRWATLPWGYYTAKELNLAHAGCLVLPTTIHGKQERPNASNHPSTFPHLRRAHFQSYLFVSTSHSKLLKKIPGQLPSLSL